jgi:hypothetical protein
MKSKITLSAAKARLLGTHWTLQDSPALAHMIDWIERASFASTRRAAPPTVAVVGTVIYWTSLLEVEIASQLIRATGLGSEEVRRKYPGWDDRLEALAKIIAEESQLDEALAKRFDELMPILVAGGQVKDYVLQPSALHILGGHFDPGIELEEYFLASELPAMLSWLPKAQEEFTKLFEEIYPKR